jgi:hypothetical protein
MTIFLILTILLIRTKVRRVHFSAAFRRTIIPCDYKIQGKLSHLVIIWVNHVFTESEWLISEEWLPSLLLHPHDAIGHVQ